MKRFWQAVAIGNGAILLDGRPIRTPAGAPLALPTRTLAHAVAEEWRAVKDFVDPRAMPLTGLSNAAIDRPSQAEALAAYAESDVLYYRAEQPPELLEAEQAAWDPMLAWARARYDVAFRVTTGIVPVEQPEATRVRLGEACAALDAFARTAMLPLVTIGGSLVAALAVLEGSAAGDSALAACHIDELWQARRWGEDALAVQAREARFADYRAAVTMLALLGRPAAA